MGSPTLSPEEPLVASALSSRPIPGGIPTADAVCGKASRENFPVASRIFPHAVRNDLLAIYGFARLADDIGDEVEGDRVAMLDWLQEELGRAAHREPAHPILARVGRTIRARKLPIEPFCDLIQANRQDQLVHTYRSYDELLSYCRLSAVPVGTVVLGVLEASTPAREALAGDVCIALQLVEHLQDVGEDARQGRVYVPVADLEREGSSLEVPEALVQRVAGTLRQLGDVEVVEHRTTEEDVRFAPPRQLR